MNEVATNLLAHEKTVKIAQHVRKGGGAGNTNLDVM